MDCRLIIAPLPDGRFRYVCDRPTCTKKGFTLPMRVDPPPAQSCNGISEAKRFINFTLASIRHVVRGAPTCTQEQIDARIAICRACELYKGVTPELGYCTHASCGCSITDMRGYVSKLAWADQSCPIGLWRPFPATAPAGSQQQTS